MHGCMAARLHGRRTGARTADTAAARTSTHSCAVIRALTTALLMQDYKGRLTLVRGWSVIALSDGGMLMLTVYYPPQGRGHSPTSTGYGDATGYKRSDANYQPRASPLSTLSAAAAVRFALPRPLCDYYLL